jgi:hypothetical protein
VGTTPTIYLAKTGLNAAISSIMKKQIRLNAFAMNCVAHQSPGAMDPSARPHG